ncbi:SDR family NAD(P)-dependent oxidoreductase [Alteromonas ponticola]|uniref:SDR family oxidoreductase n=1 Tax=Alteromonas ponticola TaxID=2720613 RepID=A0ABX1R0M9_9ALTE|nr:SDR family oxidoreductase [Alteromonas ponticola]NMH58828.1 SDR family oxidoreductase [Alteromonas ponticola]
MPKAIVTGGNGLIGKVLCQQLIKQGWQVASFDTNDSVKGVESVCCDVGNENSVKHGFAALGWQNLDLLINCAGKTDYSKKPLAEQSYKDWQEVINTNLNGTFLMSREAVKHMQSGSNIINITSTRAFMSEPGDFSYGASKGGIVSLTQAMAISLGPDIRVNAIAPGWISDESDLREIDHQQHPAGRVGKPLDVYQAVDYLLKADFVTGQVLVVDGGMTKKMIYEE